MPNNHLESGTWVLHPIWGNSLVLRFTMRLSGWRGTDLSFAIQVARARSKTFPFPRIMKVAIRGRISNVQWLRKGVLYLAPYLRYSWSSQGLLGQIVRCKNERDFVPLDLGYCLADVRWWRDDIYPAQPPVSLSVGVIFFLTLHIFSIVYVCLPLNSSNFVTGE